MPIISGGGASGGSSFLTATATLTNAQIKALAHPTPVQIVAAPGVGSVIRLVEAFMTVDAVAAKYTNIAATATLTLGYIGGSDVSTPVRQSVSQGLGVLLGLDVEVTFITIPPIIGLSVADGATSLPFDASEGENLPLGISIFNPVNLDLTGGNAANTARILVWYTVETLP